MSIAYVAGFIVGVLMVALVGFLVNKLATGKFGMKKCEFDERQNLAKGLAYRDGFWATFIGIFIAILLGNILEARFQETMGADVFRFYSSIICILCFFGITVFLVSSIMRDAYVGLNQKKERWKWILFFIGTMNLLPAVIIPVLHDTFSFTKSVLNLCCAALMYSGFIALIIRSFLDKKEGFEEE